MTVLSDPVFYAIDNAVYFALEACSTTVACTIKFC